MQRTYRVLYNIPPRIYTYIPIQIKTCEKYCEKYNETNQRELEKIHKKLTNMQMINISMYGITLSYYVSSFFTHFT